MFKNSTVFILGAGASWHYGYPTGEDLLKKVIEKSSIAARYFEQAGGTPQAQQPNYLQDGDFGANCREAHAQCLKLKAGLEQVKPLVIDYYLGWNLDLQNIGRLLIAWVILECEHRSQNTSNNINRDHTAPDDWCRFIIHQLAIDCKESKDLLRNQISFVTFNYDVSLESQLLNGLKHIQMFDEKDVHFFLGGSRIIHIYGKIRDEMTATPVDWDVLTQDSKGFGDAARVNYNMRMKMLLDVLSAASKGLRVIDPHDKGTDDVELEKAQAAIAGARRVFILGYGFDENNNRRLNLREHLRHSGERRDWPVAFTNFRDINQINKRASRLFYGGAPQYFPPGGPAVVDRYEKSVRNTYDALAMDFDLID